MYSGADADYATIGGLLLDPHQLDAVRGWLRAEDFARPLCGEVYELIGSMMSAARPVDPVTVLGELRCAGRVRADGYPAGELIAMVEAVPSAAMTPFYARLVLEAATFRSIDRVGTRLSQVGRHRRGTPDDAFDTVTATWGDLADVRERWRRSQRPAPADYEVDRSPIRLGHAIEARADRGVVR